MITPKSQKRHWRTRTTRLIVGVLLAGLAGCAAMSSSGARTGGVFGYQSTRGSSVADRAISIVSANHQKTDGRVPGSREAVAERRIDRARAVRRAVTGQKYTNLWDRIRAGFRLPPMHGPLVTQYEQWFESNPQYVERMLERANLYLYQIVRDVQKRHMPMEIALLPAIESAYSPNADSSAGAIGLWQIEPSTGGLWGLKDNWWYSGARDVIASTNAALDYLQALHNQFHSWSLALAAYNCGAGTVQWAIDNNKAQGLGTHYQELRLPLQTEHYVPKLMAFVNIVRDPAKFGLRLRDIPNSPYFVRVNTGGQISLNVVARLANMSLDQLAAINPGFKHWATAPNGPYTVLVPVATKAALLEGLSQLPPQDRMQWARHIVIPGNTISGIAQEYGVSVHAIMTTNHLYGSFLRVGQRLLIPVAGRRLVVAARGDEYTVTPGDTLSGIAQQYGVPISTLMAVNNLNSPYLQVGEVLRIPSGAGGTASPPVSVSAAAPVPVVSTITTASTVTVTPGDTLSGIAQQYGVPIGTLMAVNNLNSPYLQVGEVLRIPFSNNARTVIPGDTLSSIAQQYGVTVGALMAVNNLTSPFLQVGEVLRIPVANNA